MNVIQNEANGKRQNIVSYQDLDARLTHLGLPKLFVEHMLKKMKPLCGRKLSIDKVMEYVWVCWYEFYFDRLSYDYADETLLKYTVPLVGYSLYELNTVGGLVSAIMLSQAVNPMLLDNFAKAPTALAKNSKVLLANIDLE